jgi:hypothetical protein
MKSRSVVTLLAALTLLGCSGSSNQSLDVGNSDSAADGSAPDGSAPIDAPADIPSPDDRATTATDVDGRAEADVGADQVVRATAIINGVQVGPGRLVTQRNDSARTGANREEQVLTAANVAGLTLLDRWAVGGEVYAQILVVDGVQTPGGPRNLAIVATMEDTLLAFDLDAPPGAAPFWKLGAMHELGGPLYSARNIGGNNGILSTPVVDRQAGRVYLVSRDCDPASSPDAPRCEQRLFAIDLAAGKVSSQVAIHGSVAVAGGDASTSAVAFDPGAHWSRTALLLQGGRLFVGFAPGPNGDQHEEGFVYHGWVFAYDASDLAKAPDVYCTTPHGRGGGIWQAGSGLAGDDRGVYFASSNSILDNNVHPPAEFPTQPRDQENSVIRLPVGGPFPGPAAAVPHYWDNRAYRADGNVFQFMESGDCEIGSSGPMLVPDTRRLVVGSKPGILYVLDRDTMQATQEPLSPFRSLPLQAGHTLYIHSWWGIPPIYQAPVFWRPDDPQTHAPASYGLLFAWASEDKLESFRFDYDTGTLREHLTAAVPVAPGGGNLSLSAAGGVPGSAVLWATTAAGSGPSGLLRAFDASTLAPLFQAELAGWSRFTPPTVARGRVLVPSTPKAKGAPQEVLIFGLRAGQ